MKSQFKYYKQAYFQTLGPVLGYLVILTVIFSYIFLTYKYLTGTIDPINFLLMAVGPWIAVIIYAAIGFFIRWLKQS